MADEGDYAESLKYQYNETKMTVGDPKLDVLLDIRANSQSPIQSDAPNTCGHWRASGEWVEDPIQSDAPQDSSMYGRQNGMWIEAVGREEFELYKAEDNRVQWRGSWKSLDGVTIGQLCTADDTAEPIAFNFEAVPSDYVSIEFATGEISIAEDMDVLAIAMNIQVGRELSGGGDVSYGIALEVFNGTAWEPVADSTRLLTLASANSGEIQHLSYSVVGTSIPRGTRLRYVQACSDASKSVGLYSGQLLSSLPVAAGLVVSISGQRANA